MGAATSLALLLLAPAAPAPGVAPPSGAGVDHNQALLFAGRVVEMAFSIEHNYVRPVAVPDLLEAALRGMYEEVGVACPDEVIRSVRRGRTVTDYSEALAAARVSLGNPAALDGPRALFAAVNGFRYATDPNTGLVAAARRDPPFASVEMDCGFGLELEGVTPARWAIYDLEVGFRTGRFPHDPAVGPVSLPAPPVSYPWRVRRIVPGSPCQQAGLRPGDVITHLDGTAVGADNSARLFRELVNASVVLESPAAPSRGKRSFIVRRPGVAEPLKVVVEAKQYVPESLFGVVRTGPAHWDCLLDRDARIGYVRLGFLEKGTEERLSAVLDDLAAKDCRGFILDLRWSPGGYVDATTNVAGLFLDNGRVITTMADGRPERRADRVVKSVYEADTPAGVTKYAARPLVVLVGPETAGGGEMIAAALQDHKRAVVMGQRTVGKGTIQTPSPAGVGDLQFRLSTGYSLRPNGKSRHRFADSKPTDDWGVRPDVGSEVPVTPDFGRELRARADLHGLRPAGSREALPFDDPATDPARLAALRYLRKTLGPVAGK